jgi:hypothetical protein
MNKIEISNNEELISVTWECNGKTEYFRFVECDPDNMKAKGCSNCAFHRGNMCSVFPTPRCSYGCRKDLKDGNFIAITLGDYVSGIRRIEESKGFDPEMIESILG